MNDLERFFFYEKHKKIHKILHYFEAYDRYFSRYRGKDIVILEIGVSGGGSLQMWKNYFKTAGNTVQIYGIDINPACKALEEENIKIYIGSQEDRDFLRMIKNEIGKVDILIDDGGHTMSQQIITFEELFDIVSDDGVYLCEDTCTSYMSSFGGGYRCNSFVEYAKSKIDDIHAFYSETNELKPNHYSRHIKSISYFDSMVFFEKKQESGELCFFWTENK
ncbi:MAG: class I SAM-dependent methyltransferase [Lachnospiraceae bacterium]|nr:class I SAM-dependent methyltransferase [Lachnospiraceae bacterium]